VGEERESKELPALLPNLDKKERVNILLLGVDQREGKHGPWRTDTMIVLTVDPKNLTAGMLSIPRDLWVPIPGYGENRINTAHYIGDWKGYPGGGTALAKKTVQYNLGIPIHYYVRINFKGFENVIDTIGGVDIYVEKEINDPKYPDDDYGYDPLYIPAGWQHMDGELALKYVRTRHGGSDFHRLRRQQQLIMAVREKVLRLDLIFQLLPKLPQLITEMKDSIQTDVPLEDIIRLAKLVSQIKEENIKVAAINSSMTVPWKTPKGEDVLIPIREKIRPVVDEIFKSEIIVDEVEIKGLSKLAEEEAKIVVYNGTTTENLAKRAATFLKEQGLQVVEFGNADRFDYQRTIIVDYTGKSYTVAFLARLFNVGEEEIIRNPNSKSEVDILLIIGRDFNLK
jgi:LCP family protein required for cell wall assembly